MTLRSLIHAKKVQEQKKIIEKINIKTYILP